MDNGRSLDPSQGRMFPICLHVAMLHALGHVPQGPYSRWSQLKVAVVADDHEQGVARAC